MVRPGTSIANCPPQAGIWDAGLMRHDRGKAMAREWPTYGDVETTTDLKRAFAALRRDAEQADTCEWLIELYRRAGYLITLTHAPSWRERFARQADDLRQAGEREFSHTAHAINQRARAIGVEAGYAELWGE
jgi:hypothetical protein